MKSKKNLTLIVLVLLVALTSGYVASTYAKYTEVLSDTTATADVAKWAFAKGTDNGELEISLPSTIPASRLVADKIAPGTGGSFNLDLDNSEGEVGVEFEITFKNLTNVPSNLVFKQSSTAISIANSKITGTIPAGGTLAIPLDWEWPYETSGTLAAEDLEDTTDGKAADTMSITATIKGTQVNPNGAAITASYTLGSAN